MDHDIGASSSDGKREQSERKQKEPVRRRDVESGIGIDIELPERHDRADDTGGVSELAELRRKLDEAEENYKKAKADVEHPGTGRWVKYVIFTATEQANTAESSDFANARAVLLGGVLGMAGTMVSYLLPAIDMNQVQSLDNAVNTTSAAQRVTDTANIKYYWGNAGTYGFLSLTALIGGLAGIRKSYKAMRERILARAEAEREQAQTKHDKYVKHTATLRAAQQKCDALEKSRDEERVQARKSEEKIARALDRVAQLEADLGKVRKDYAVLDLTLQQQQKTTAAEQDRAKDLGAQIDGLLGELSEATRLGKSSQEEAGRLHARVKELEGELALSKKEIEKQELLVGALQRESEAAKLVIGILENSAKKLDQVDKRIGDVSTQITQLGEKAQAAHGTTDKSTQTD